MFHCQLAKIYRNSVPPKLDKMNTLYVSMTGMIPDIREFRMNTHRIKARNMWQVRYLSN